MPPKQNMAESSSWAYNLRHLTYGSDSDSEANSPAASNPEPAQVISDDTRLLQDLDLASRQDEAVYKPNPWTIAKVNAAVRPAVADVKTSRVPQEAPRKRKQPEGRIVDGFKKQTTRPVVQDAKLALKPQRIRQPHPSDTSTGPSHKLLNAKEQIRGAATSRQAISHARSTPALVNNPTAASAASAASCNKPEILSDRFGQYSAHITTIQAPNFQHNNPPSDADSGLSDSVAIAGHVTFDDFCSTAPHPEPFSGDQIPFQTNPFVTSASGWFSLLLVSSCAYAAGISIPGR